MDTTRLPPQPAAPDRRGELVVTYAGEGFFLGANKSPPHGPCHRTIGSSVSVKAAVPGGGSFTIFLTGNAPAGGLRIAYFVLNEPHL